MDFDKLIQINDSLAKVIDENNDYLGDESLTLKREHKILNSDELRELLEKIDNKERLLQIGVVGRVKAGKSSLLNALLFEGENILPKAATPMTAALTTISYGDEFSAKADFFSTRDIEILKHKHEEYDRRLEVIKNTKIEELKNKRNREKSNQTDSIKHKVGKFIEKVKPLSEDELDEISKKALKFAKKELEKFIELVAAHDQYGKMKTSGINVQSLPSEKIIEAKTIEELRDQLGNFVGANGEYMPFTKSVHILLPLENLRNIQIIDTPGVNDPVLSREERTRELLKYCDVIFIVSPSGQFLSKEDMDLMDKISTKEGIREIFLVASQTDTQLYGSEKENAEGDLRIALRNITSNLGLHMSKTLSNLKRSNPEIGTVFDRLIIEGKNRVLHSAGICQSIKNAFDNRSNWDDGMNTAWENLKFEYPDYFSDNDKALTNVNLDLLANNDKLKEVVEDVRLKKDEILQKRKDEFVEAKSNTIFMYKEALLAYVSEQSRRVNEFDIDELKKQKKEIGKVQKKASIALQEEYQELIDQFRVDMKKRLKEDLENLFKKSNTEIDNKESIKTKSYTSGWLFKSTHYYDVITVKAGAVRNELENLTLNIENKISTNIDNLVLDWRRSVYERLISILRSSINDDELEPQLIRKALRNVIESVEHPSIEYHGSLPDNLKQNGTLEGSSAETFKGHVENYVSELKRRVDKDLTRHSEKLTGVLKKINISDDIFSDYNKKIEQLENQISNKKITLTRFNTILTKLGSIK
ncbi:MAG: dynamin family protein [Candidatus Delongbacteria bacterium]|nr:dynamin family protein [Candidatus Delongbacteria bacterium]MBN2836911.1 dynamin family protein [Candidatus Delongbacteria bacterium]